MLLRIADFDIACGDRRNVDVAGRRPVRCRQHHQLIQDLSDH